MYYLMSALGGIAGIASLVCFIMVLIQIFQHGQTGLGIACIVLLFCVGIGAIIAFVVGWMNVDKWRIKNVMLIWTVCVVLGILFNGLSYMLMPKGLVAG